MPRQFPHRLARPWRRWGLSVLLGVAAVGPSLGQDWVLLIGGGDQADNSQAQIEANTRWARQVLTAIPGERRLRLYFTDGSDPAPDVTEWQPPPEDAAAMQPLARVLNAYWSNGQRFRNHSLGPVDGGTRSNLLSAALARQLGALKAEDRVLLVFNGHGAWDQDDPLGNRILLWDSSALDVRELRRILDLAPAETDLRFVFTQCYAGAFSALARPGWNRCGFLAEAADQPAEGCSAAMDRSDFQDYSSHFFAALAGRDRFGEPLRASPDRDGDRRVSPLEAHYYTLVYADSSDIPRSTSEAFLLAWDPWFLDLGLWLNAGEDSRYQELARELATYRGLDPGRPLKPQIRTGRTGAERGFGALRNEQTRVRERIDDLRRPLELELLRRWPEAGYAYTQGFRRFLEQDLEAAQSFILDHEDYPSLVRAQDRYWVLEEQVLDAERGVTAFDRIEHLLALARREALLQARGDAADRARYLELLACESAPL